MRVKRVGPSGRIPEPVRRMLAGLPTDLGEATPELARANTREMVLEQWSSRESWQPGSLEVYDTHTSRGGIPVRIYRPPGGARVPLTVFCHGGGWVVCDLDTHDFMCRSLALCMPSVVVSAGYRLAPEHKFPAGLRDCLEVSRWAAGCAGSLRADPSQLILAGDSAGGNLAASVCLLARQEGSPPIACQLLLYPVVDVSRSDRASYRRFGAGFGLTATDMNWYRDMYLSRQSQAQDVLVSPLLLEDATALPATHIVTAECDLLRDEGEMYAKRLAAAGVATTCTRYNGMVHGFLSMDGLVEGIQGIYDEITAQVRRHLGDGPLGYCTSSGG